MTVTMMELILIHAPNWVGFIMLALMFDKHLTRLEELIKECLDDEDAHEKKSSTR